MRRAALALCGVLAAIALLFLITDLPGDRGNRPPLPHDVPVMVVDHGYHAGLVLPRALLAARAQALGLARLAAALSPFVAYDHVEIGWGDEGFYRNVPSLSVATLPQALRALFASGNGSVLHVVGVAGDPAAYFARSDRLRLDLPPEGFDKTAASIDATLATGPAGPVEALGPGLYGPSLFFRAVGDYHLMRNCNHWIARTVNAAGRRVSLAAATVSAGLMADLRLRGGAVTP
ncbi:DUF2459 domain-containing protein [Xanthobacter sp. KR7-65]|uniref:DUF2459 domain-containing protein n=1 Tax=Xanthobacter sp. KR7-65 TaxID=3156612 RepID=UPI0032B4C931